MGLFHLSTIFYLSCSFKIFGYTLSHRSSEDIECPELYPLELYTNAFGIPNHYWCDDGSVILYLGDYPNSISRFQYLGGAHPTQPEWYDEICTVSFGPARLHDLPRRAGYLCNYNPTRVPICIKKDDVHHRLVQALPFKDVMMLHLRTPQDITTVAHLLPRVRVIYIYVYEFISFELFEQLHAVEYIRVSNHAAGRRTPPPTLQMKLDPEGYLINMKHLKGLEIYDHWSAPIFTPYKIDVLGYFSRHCLRHRSELGV